MPQGCLESSYSASQAAFWASTIRSLSSFTVSPSLVYAYVERKQISHLRVMGSAIRFPKSDLEPLRASFRQEVENGKTE